MSRSICGLVLQFVKDDGGFFDAVLEGVGGEVHLLLRNGDEADEVGEIGYGAFEPAGLREAGAIFVIVEDAVGKTGVGDGIFNVVGVADGDRVAQGYRCLDSAGLAHYLETEAVGGVLLGLRCGFVLGFYGHRGAARCRYKHVSVAAGWSGRSGCFRSGLHYRASWRVGGRRGRCCHWVRSGWAWGTPPLGRL